MKKVSYLTAKCQVEKITGRPFTWPVEFLALLYTCFLSSTDRKDFPITKALENEIQDNLLMCIAFIGWTDIKEARNLA